MLPGIVKCLNVITLLLLLPLNVSAFYFYHEGSERKCFTKELTQASLLNIVFKVQVYDDSLKAYKTPSDNDFGVTIDVEEIFDGDQRVVHQKGGAEGDFTFNTEESGEHRICLQPQSSGWLSKTKTKIDLELTVDSDKTLDSKRKVAIESLHGKINVLNSRMAEVRREQSLMRDRESQFRDMSEAVNSNAMWWSVIQLIILGVTCAWQMKHLSTFFVKQKVL